MSTTTNLHDLEHVTVTDYAEDNDHPAFTSVQFADRSGNSVNVFTYDLPAFLDQISHAVTNRREVTA